jgi:hypothetical protein
MPYRILFLALALLAVSALAGAATLPASPAPAANPAWLQPAANSTPAELKKPGKAPLGAIFKSGCSSACLQDEFACYNGCDGDHSCNVNCNNDYYCCVQACDPNLPQCF